MTRILVSTMANSVFLTKVLVPRHLKPLAPLLSNYSLTKSKNPFIFTDITFLRSSEAPKASKIKTNWRQLSDKLFQKGKGDEHNYFLRIRREQFLKLKERKIKEIVADLRALEAEVREMDHKTSLRAETVRQNLMVEIRELKALLEKFKKSL
ncbi:uncharacterized protein [Drosophila kikkawai]|uniref:Uncharacterized protein isoform X1 n=1 Tax=Drosophila kikkawai TaxID=30033 RepID=A0A6P4I926_DROKI|nr:uncharacterized protein LOC108076366 isoform X1 [Drosophila kikkawai]